MYLQRIAVYNLPGMYTYRAQVHSGRKRCRRLYLHRYTTCNIYIYIYICQVLKTICVLYTALFMGIAPRKYI